MADKPTTSKLNVRQRRVARTLRTWLAESQPKISQEALAKQLKWSVGKMNNILNAKSVAGPAEVIAIATLLGVDERERDRVVTFARAGLEGDVWWRTYSPGTVPEWFHDYLETEAEAEELRMLDGLLVPGLLQVVGYTREMVQAWLDPNGETVDETVHEERLRLRQQRQARLDASDNPLRLHAIIAEAALHQPVGGRAVMAEQLGHLAARAEQPNITIQVLPTELGAYPGFGSSYRLLSFDGGTTSALYLENLDSGFYVEDRRDLEVYTMNHERLARVALDPDASVRRLFAIRSEWAQA